MGMLVNGEWRDVWYDTSRTGYRFMRQGSAFRNWVTADGGSGPTGDGGFPGERGRRAVGDLMKLAKHHPYVPPAAATGARTHSKFLQTKGMDCNEQEY
jgi:hypothetical protein